MADGTPMDVTGETVAESRTGSLDRAGSGSDGRRQLLHPNRTLATTVIAVSELICGDTLLRHETFEQRQGGWLALGRMRGEKHPFGPDERRAPFPIRPVERCAFRRERGFGAFVEELVHYPIDGCCRYQRSRPTVGGDEGIGAVLEPGAGERAADPISVPTTPARAPSAPRTS